jgi:hypothetical protein
VALVTPLLVRPTRGEVERAPQGQRGMYAAGGETSQSVTTSVRRPPGSAPENLIFTLVKYLRPAALTVWERKNWAGKTWNVPFAQSGVQSFCRRTPRPLAEVAPHFSQVRFSATALPSPHASWRRPPPARCPTRRRGRAA